VAPHTHTSARPTHPQAQTRKTEWRVQELLTGLRILAALNEGVLSVHVRV